MHSPYKVHVALILNKFLLYTVYGYCQVVTKLIYAGSQPTANLERIDFLLTLSRDGVPPNVPWPSVMENGAHVYARLYYFRQLQSRHIFKGSNHSPP